MNPMDGKLVMGTLLGAAEEFNLDPKFLVPVPGEKLTKKQRDRMRVSTYDCRTPVGRMARNARNMPCPCGSGRKLKKCCEKHHEPRRRRYGLGGGRDEDLGGER